MVFTDRGLNHMSEPFKAVMRDLNSVLSEAYNAKQAILLPGSGTFAMEAVARQLGYDNDVLVVRNGFFSYRWTDIFEQGDFVNGEYVHKAQPDAAGGDLPQFGPPPIEEVVAAIKELKPSAVFAPQVETSVGLQIPDEYIKQLADAVHAVGGHMVLDCIAAGTVWVDMEALGVDFLVTAPQKGWSSPACAGVVMVSEAGREAVLKTKSSSMALNLGKWMGVMDAYLADSGPGHSYYSTMPTDCLRLFRDTAQETRDFGWQKSKDKAIEMGTKVRAMLASKGFKSVAAPAYAAPGVVVVYTDDAKMYAKLGAAGLQVAAGVPWKIGEKTAPGQTFRMGLFGLDKLADVDGTVKRLEAGIDAAMAAGPVVV